MLLPDCAGIVNRQLVVATESCTLTISGGNVGPKNRFHVVSLVVFIATTHVQQGSLDYNFCVSQEFYFSGGCSTFSEGNMQQMSQVSVIQVLFVS